VLAVLGLSGLGVLGLVLARNPGASRAAAPRGTAAAPLATVPLTQPLLFEGFETGFNPLECRYRLGDDLTTSWCLYATAGYEDKQWQQTDLGQPAHRGEYSIRHEDTITPQQADSWLVTPLVTPTIDSELIFWQYERYPDFYQGHSVMISTQRGDPKYDEFTALIPDLGPGTEFVWEPLTVSLSSYAGQPIFLAFRYHSVGDGDMWYLDDVEVTTDLVVSNDSPTPLGHATTMTAGVAPGRDATFTWDFGDTHTGSGSTVTHTYAAAGTYTVVVTASNSLTPTITRSMQVTVQRTVYLPLMLRD
jgi:hypothetical protein